MRYTLLELVKRVLESMESDEVSDINETPEAVSVANIIKECYFDIVGDLEMAEQEGLFKLDASGDDTKPCLMTVPSTVAKIDWLKYNISDDTSEPSYQYVDYRDNEEFILCQPAFDSTDTNMGKMTVTINSLPFIFYYRKDGAPKYYTVFDEQYVIFDSYDSDLEDTLTQANSLGFGKLVPAFEFENDFVPDLDPRQFQLLLQDAKQTAFTELKQAQNPLAEKKYRRNKILTQRNSKDNNPEWSNQLHASFGRRSSFSPMKRAMRQGS